MNKLNSLKKLTAAASAALAIALTFSCTDDKDDDDKSSASGNAGSSSSVAAGGSSSSSAEDMFCYNSDGAGDCDGIGPMCGLGGLAYGTKTQAECAEREGAVVMSKAECLSNGYSIGAANCMQISTTDKFCLNEEEGDLYCFGIGHHCNIETQAECTSVSYGGSVMNGETCISNDYPVFFDCMAEQPDYPDYPDYDDNCPSQNYIEPDGYCFNSVQDGECDPMPQYVTEEECRERPYAAVVDIEWCESANARAWKYCADNYYDGGYGKILPKKGMSKKSMLKKSMKK